MVFKYLTSKQVPQIANPQILRTSGRFRIRDLRFSDSRIVCNLEICGLWTSVIFYDLNLPQIRKIYNL